MDEQTRQRRVFSLVYIYNSQKVSVCLSVCLYVLYSRELGWTDRDKPYIFQILRVPRATSRNFFPIIPVLKGIMGRFVRVGGLDMLILWATQSARVSVQVLKSASSSEDSDRTSCRKG